MSRTIRQTFAIAATMIASVVLAMDVQATDLVLKGIRFEWGEPREDQASLVQFEIRNDNVLAAENYTIHFVAKYLGEDRTDVDAYLEPPRIAPNTDLVVSLPFHWTPRWSGSYQLTATIDFADEIDPSDNEKIETITVLPRLFLPRLIWQDIQAPYRSNDKSYSALEYRYAPSPTWRYLNVRAWTFEDKWSWVLKNKPVPPNTDSVTMTQSLWLGKTIADSTQDSVRFAFGLTTDTLSTDTVLKAYTTLGFEKDAYSYGGVNDTTTTFSLSLSTLQFSYSSGVPQEGLTIGCTMPNIDLNNTANGPGSIADYAGDKNACAVAAAANSLQWLDDTWSDVNPGNSHRAKLIELSRMMRRARERGVWSEDFLAAKLEFINKYDLPIRVKFQRRGSTEDVESQDDYLSTADNQGDGGYPKFDWIKQEIRDSEDVELFVEYHADGGSGSTVTGRHVVVLTGAHSTTSSNELWYKDDGDQGTVGGTQERSVTWDTLSNGVPYFDPWKGADNITHITVPYAVFSESRDTSVHRQGRSTLQRLGRSLYGFVFGRRSEGVDSSIDHGASTSLRFANIVSPSITFLEPTTTPIGNDLGERATTIIHGDYLDLRDSSTILRSSVWYADTVLTDTAKGALHYSTYTIRPLLDSSRLSSLNLGTELYRSPDTVLSAPWRIKGAYTPTDTVLRWLHVQPHDLDSSGTRLRYNAPLSDRGAQGEAALLSALRALSSDTTFGIGPDRVQQLIDLSERTKRKPEGTGRTDLIGGFMQYLYDLNIPLRVHYQSNTVTENAVGPPGSAYQATKTPSSTGWPRSDYMIEALRSAPAVVEVGEYNAAGRVGGFYALCTGIMRYNGVTQLVLDRDFAEGSRGGLHRTIQRVVMEDDVPVLYRMASPTSRAVVESFIRLRYDPTISSVGEDRSREIAALSVAPNPATEVITVRADLYASPQATIDVVSTTGTTVATMTVDASTLAHGVRLTTSSWAPGLYIIRCSTLHASISQSILVIR